jgi:uncharacterized protein with ParB-like and HNH nuclease domain
MPAIEFDKETIGHILQGRKGLHVPINQRSYQWKKEHVEDLYKDLNGALTTNAEEYFLGTIVVVMRPKSKDIEVYDGQQRLATSMILIAAIRDYFFNFKRPSDCGEDYGRESLLRGAQDATTANSFRP